MNNYMPKKTNCQKLKLLETIKYEELTVQKVCKIYHEQLQESSYKFILEWEIKHFKVPIGHLIICRLDLAAVPYYCNANYIYFNI